MQGVILNGGLGNQLFQIAAAMNSIRHEDVLVICDAGNPRTRSNFKPDISGFILPPEIYFGSIESRSERHIHLIRRSLNLMLRLSSQERRKLFLILWLPFRFFSTVAIKKAPYFIFGKGVGFSDIKAHRRNFFLCGYFQSYKYADEITFAKLMSIRPSVESELYKELQAKAIEVKSIMVHLRLGDYLETKDYGVPGVQYYSSAIEYCKRLFPLSPIWLFTNDKEEAMRNFAEINDVEIQCFPDIPESPSENLNLLRYGQAYVIGNSTFSWWGSFLRFNREAPVIYPTPWYKKMPTPKNLVPPSWIPMESDFRH